MSTVRDQIGKQAMELMHDLREMREAAADPGGERLDQSTETEFDYCEQGPDRLLYGEFSAQQFISEQPIKTLLLAAGAGALLGVLWTIRRR
jgi:hypothetical protein